MTATKKAPPPESVMLPVLLVLGAVAAIAVAIPASGAHAKGAAWLPWAFLAMGLVGLGTGILDKQQKIDFKAGAKANAFVLLLGPVGARIAWTLVGGAFLGGGIGLLVA